VPTSIVYHRYSASITPLKYFLLERNRHILLLKHFKIGTLITLMPALILAEALAWGYAIKRGYAREKVEAYVWILRRWREILTKRSITQSLRKISDKELLNSLSYIIPLSGLTESLSLDKFSTAILRVFNILFKMCYIFAKGLAR